MANRRVTTMDLKELIRLLRAGASDRRIGKLLGHTRRTVQRYRSWASEQGLLAGEVPPLAEVQQRVAATLPAAVPPQQTSTVQPYAEVIREYRRRGLEVAAIRVRLEEEHRVSRSYRAIWRYVRQLEPATPEAFVRVEVPAGSEAQVDFGAAGLAIDPVTGELRQSWVFVMVLSWSRYAYAEVVFDQRVETWLLCHAHAFAFFGGVPARIVPDNLKAAIVRASFTEPLGQRAYRECAGHYGFLIDPNPPYSPHLKGKVENGVHYVKRNFLAGRDPAPLAERNAGLRRWLVETAGQRLHGTTKERPWDRFAETERAVLLPLPATAYDPASWQLAKVGRDCYVTFDRSYYSAPYRLVGQSVVVRGGARTVERYTADHALVATHDRATTPGTRRTVLAHLPPEQVPGLLLSREGCRAQATAIGPSTAELVDQLLAHRPEDRLRSAGRVVGLAGPYSAERLEAACARAAHYGDLSYPTVKRILVEGLDRQPLASPTSSVPTRTETTGTALQNGTGFTFVRQAGEFMASVLAAAGVR